MLNIVYVREIICDARIVKKAGGLSKYHKDY